MADTVKELEDEWNVWLEPTYVNSKGQTKKTIAEIWREDNPLEYDKLLLYRNGGPKPSLATSMGKQMVEHVEAYLVAKGGGTPPPTPTGSEIPTYEVTITPNWVSTNDDPANNYNAMWVYGTSPTTPYLSPDSWHQVGRYLLLDPRYKDGNGLAGNDEWWFIAERYWPSAPAFDPNNHGKWGREVNWHNCAGDAGSAENGNGGVGWGFGSGVSALALDWLNQDAAPSINVQPQKDFLNDYGRNPGNGYYPMPVPSRDTWHTYLLHWIAGRTDGTTVRPGMIQIWADGKLVWNQNNINTVQKANGNVDGKPYVQRWMTLWDGDYTSWIENKATTRFSLMRIGKTFAEVKADVPRELRNYLEGQHYRGEGINLGPPTLTSITPRKTGEAILPTL